MNKLLIATLAAGAAVAGLLLYLRSQTAERRFGIEIADAADDAHDTMNKHINKTERAFDYALN